MQEGLFSKPTILASKQPQDEDNMERGGEKGEENGCWDPFSSDPGPTLLKKGMALPSRSSPSRKEMGMKAHNRNAG